MAIKQRVLDKLATIEKDFIEASEAKPQDALADALALLSETKNECRQGLPESRHADYDELCDGLMLALGQLATGQATEDKGEVLSLCGDLLKILNKKIEDEGGFKKEIVFLPYKSSMWDSLESVWRAACEDKEHCIPYVIPIPYADLTPEHTVAEWHCEKDIFPKDVPVVDWQTVDLAAMHPDVIFIHNPYDEYNRVTSVESRYYSSALKRQTDKLVYIPYFVINEPEIDGKTEDEIETIENDYEPYILTPAVLNSHQVIVQSEVMKQVYIDVLTRRTDRTDRAFWEKRILGMGSPKFDKVATTKREDLDIPEQWLKIIRKPDGSWKKIIFYNTGLSALLHNDEKMLAKMRQVFRTFKEHKDEIALLWRPHPLIPATIQSMRPQLSEEYAGIVKQYKEEAWGIYDDSADMDRAIVLSDAYYGDWSSVVQLYQKTEKPIMIQNASINGVCVGTVIHGRQFVSMRIFSRASHFIDAVVYDGYMYYSEANFNGLFRVKNGHSEAEFIGRFPNEDIGQADLHRKVLINGSKLFFVPSHGHGVSIYDIEANKFTFIHISGKSDMIHYAQCIITDNEVLLIPAHRNTPFVRLFLNEEKIDILRDITDRVNEVLPNALDEYIFSAYSAWKEQNILWLAVLNTNLLLRLDLNTWKVEKQSLPHDVHLRFFNKINQKFWCTLQEHAILSWNPDTTECKLYEIPCETLDWNYPYLQIFSCGRDILIVSGREDHFWTFNPLHLTWTDMIYSFPEAFRRDTVGSLLFLGYTIAENGELTLYPRAGNGILKFNFINNHFNYMPINHTIETIEKLQKEWDIELVKKGVLIGESVLGLLCYLESILQFDCTQSVKKEYGLGSVGHEIIENIKDRSILRNQDNNYSGVKK